MQGFSQSFKNSQPAKYTEQKNIKNPQKRIISRHGSRDLTKSKILLNDLTNYFENISQEYAANFSIIHSNLLEFKVMIEALNRSCSLGVKEIWQMIPRQASEVLGKNKKDTDKIFVKIFRFLDKFLHTLSDFSTESKNFDKFSEITENSLSFHEIYDQDLESELISARQEIKSLNSQVTQYQKQLKTVNDYCENLLIEINAHKNTSQQLKIVLGRLINTSNLQSDSQETDKKPEFFQFSSAFESHLNKLSRKIVDREKKIDELENKYEDFEDLKTYNQTLYTELNSLSKEYTKLKQIHKDSLKRQENILSTSLSAQEKQDKSTQCIENPQESNPKPQQNPSKSSNLKENPPVPHAKPQEATNKSHKPKESPQGSKLPTLKSSKTLKTSFKFAEPSELDKAQLEIESLQTEIENYKQIIKNLSSELDETNPDQFLEKIGEIKFHRDSTYFEAQKVSDILNELEEYTGLPSGKLLSYIQENEKIGKSSCLNIFAGFEKMIKNVSSELNKKLASLETKIGSLSLNYKKIWLD